VAGNYIDNIATTATPAPANALPVALTAAFTVDQGYNAGNARAVTGASIYSLTLGGASLDLFGGNAAVGGNGNTPDGTLNLSGGILASSGAPRTIDSDTARTISFGTTAGNITTTTDLTLTANVSLTGSSGFTKAGAGNLNVNSPYVITGPVTVNAGAVNTTGNVTVGDLTVASGATFNPAAGTLTAASLNGAGAITSTAGITVNGTTAATFSGTITGSTTFTKTGTGNQTISNALAYTGATAIQQGTLTVGSANALPAANPVTFGTAAGSSLYNLTLNANQSFTGGITFIAPTTTTVIATINSGAVLTFGSDISYVNNTTTPDNHFPVQINGVGSIDLGGATRSITIQSNNNATGDVQFLVPIQNGGIAMTANPTPSATPGRFFIGVAGSTYAGTTTVNRGEFRAGAAGAFSPNSVVEIAAGTGNTATLVVNGFNQTIAGLSSNSAGSNQVTLGAGNLTVNQAINTTSNAVISGTGQLIKTGAGTLTLTGVNTYTGVTTVNGGTLFIGDGTSGSTAAGSAVTANTGATVGGGGTVNGALTIAAGATLAPGNSIGTLTVAGVTTITGAAPDTGAIWSIEASRSAANTIGSNDLLTKTGNLNFANLAAGTPAAGDNKFRLNIVNGPSPLVAGETYSMTIASGAGQIQRNGTQVNGSTFTFDANDYQMISSNFTSFTGVALTANTDGSLVLQFTPVPEPATLLGLTALGLAGYGWTRRRKTA
jgi:autotransporter-associated beta strand protein